jgi:hypothetical protein
MNSDAKTRRSGKTKWVVLGVIAALVVGGGATWRVLRGPSGATTALGGSIPATEVPEMPAAADRWVNGAPVTLAGARGQVVIVEGWHPA